MQPPRRESQVGDGVLSGRYMKPQHGLTTILATLLLPLERSLRLLDQMLTLMNGMVLDFGVMRLL